MVPEAATAVDEDELGKVLLLVVGDDDGSNPLNPF